MLKQLDILLQQFNTYCVQMPVGVSTNVSSLLHLQRAAFIQGSYS